jgi:tetratricopeptide (TPR) repeat protein
VVVQGGKTRVVVQNEKTEAAHAPSDAERLLKLVQHRWFGARFPQDGELAVARLVLGVYTASSRGELVHKKAAAAVMGVEDVRTARKYVALAEEEGLLTATPAPDDKRKEILQPTAALRRLVQQEFEAVIRMIGAQIEEAPSEGANVSEGYEHGSSEPTWGRVWPEVDLENERLAQAREYERQGHFFGAMDSYLLMLDLEPDLAAAREGLLRLVKAKPSEAEKYYKERLEEFGIVLPGSEPREDLGDEGSRIPSGIMRIAALRPKHRRLSARAYARQIEKLNEWIAANPDDSEAYLRRGDLQRVMKKRVGVNQEGIAYRDMMDRNAIADYSRAIELKPDCVDPYLARGECLMAIGDNKGAIEDFNRALQLAPENWEAYAQRGELHGKMGNIALAFRDLDQAIALDPNRSSPFRSRARLHATTGDYQSAIVDYTEAIRVGPDDAYTYVDRGWAYEVSGDSANAEADLAEFRKRRTKALYRADIVRGALYLDIGNREKALASFHRALEDPEIKGAENRRDLEYIQEYIQQLTLSEK